MTTLRWTAGPHHGVAWPSGVVVLDEVVPLAVAVELFVALSGAKGVGLEQVCRRLDAVAAGAPAAVAVWGGAAGAGGPVSAAMRVGEGWVSQPPPGPSVSVSLRGVASTAAIGSAGGSAGGPAGGSAGGPAGGAEWRPLVAGVVPVETFVWSTAGSTGGSTAGSTGGSMGGSTAAATAGSTGSAPPPGLITSVPKAPPAPLRAGPEADHDHDGLTRAQAPRPGTPTEVPLPPADARQVLALICPSGHPNPPSRSVCRVCQRALPGPAQRVPRPPLGVLRSSAGDVLELTAPVVAGRKPRPQPGSPEAPLLLAVPVPHVSSSHVELRLEGWTVLAVDLESTNGTFLRRRGEPAMRLSSTPTPLIDGDVVDLGHGVQLTLEGLP